MITVSNNPLPTLQNTVPQQQHQRRQGGKQSGPRWSAVLQNGAAAPSEETTDTPVAADPVVPAGGINILA